MQTKTNYFYTYKITHTNGKFYVGRRTTSKEPYKDKYMGSGSWVRSIKNKLELTKEVVELCSSFDELKVAELNLISKYWNDEKCMNYIKSSCGFPAGIDHPQYGVPLPEYIKKKLSNDRIGDKNPMYGRPVSEETRKKLSESQRKVKNSGRFVSGSVTGEDHPNSKLSEEDVKEIKSKMVSGAKNIDLSKEYVVHKSTISKIRNGKIWSHL